MSEPFSPRAATTTRGRVLVLIAALGAWGGAGVELGLGPLTARPAAQNLIALGGGTAAEGLVGSWFAYFLAAFLLGGAAGGWLFGMAADRFGRVRALGASVLCYSVLTAANYLVQTPEQLFALRFLASLGIGGTWAAATPLAAEAWAKASRPMVAGLLGASANVGILAIALVAVWIKPTEETWRNATLLGGFPAILGVWILVAVPESPLWRPPSPGGGAGSARGPLAEALTPPLLSRTILGTVLGTVPLLGTWSASKLILPWADKLADNDEIIYAIWAGGATIGSLFGGWIANLFGRRTTYFAIAVATLGINLAIYGLMTPAEPVFLPAVFLLGLVATVFFGWLPLYLPELFPTRVRATGSGITFNSGRVLAAGGNIVVAALLARFDGDYPRVGGLIVWIYVVGMVAILFAPDTSRKRLDEGPDVPPGA